MALALVYGLWPTVTASAVQPRLLIAFACMKHHPQWLTIPAKAKGNSSGIADLCVQVVTQAFNHCNELAQKGYAGYQFQLLSLQSGSLW